jgi:hypothetical protein
MEQSRFICELVQAQRRRQSRIQQKKPTQETNDATIARKFFASEAKNFHISGQLKRNHQPRQSRWR